MDTISNPKDVILIGKDTDYYTTLEGALKIREITYDNILSVPSGELKHGSLALVSDTTTAIVVITKEQLVQKNINAVNEITARGGKCIIITPFDIDVGVPVFKIPNLVIITDIASIIPLQLYSLHRCIDYGYNPDKPRNLAKSVTVE